MSAPRLELTGSMICARCDRQMVITKDAVGHERKWCPWCDGVAKVRPHPDEVLLPQGPVKVTLATLPPIEPGQLRCQICARGVEGRARSCRDHQREHHRATRGRLNARKREQRRPQIYTCRCGAIHPYVRGRRQRLRCPTCSPVGTRSARVCKPKPCSGCRTLLTPTGPRSEKCAACR